MPKERSAHAGKAENVISVPEMADRASIATVILPVEPEPGSRFEVVISNPLKDWADLDVRAWSERRQDGTYVLRDDHFRYDKLIRDAVRACIQRDAPEESPPSPPTKKGQPLVVLLESLHKDEYSQDLELFEPQFPLNLDRSRKQLRRHLRRLTEAAGLEWADMESREVVLVNPVPFQTSMHRFLLYAEGIRRDLRDQVWCALFSQVLWFRVSLRQRLCDYSPVLILNACTKNLQDDVHEWLRTLPFQAERVSNHPSMWFTRDRLLRHDEVRIAESPCRQV